MKAKNPYKINLSKGRMAERGYTAVDLAKRIDRQADYVRKRVRQPDKFQLGEAYVICALLEIAPAEIPKYFPEEER